MKNILIIFGGNSTEHEISCESAKAIFTNIDQNLFNPKLVGISKDNNWYEFNDSIENLNKNWLKSTNISKLENIIEYLKNFDCIFPITHGNNGEDGKLQGMLDLFNIKYVGSKTLASSIGMDKQFSKILFEHLGINQVPYMCINENDNIKSIDIEFPVIVKPANGGSSIGISKANNFRELKKAIKEAIKYDKKIIIEKFIKARELEVAILENNNDLIISEIGEIISCNSFYDYKAKYKQKSKTIITTDLDKNLSNKIKEFAKKIFIGINASNYARIDFFLDNNTIYINEINTIPGFTEISMFPKLIIDKNISYKDLITILINNAN